MSKVPLSPDGLFVGDCDLIFADEEGDTAGEPRTSCDAISKENLIKTFLAVRLTP